MPKNVQICDAGECDGCCLKCRVWKLTDELQAAQRDLEDLRAAVDEMRHDQREYFRTRSPEALRKARASERRVDDLRERSGAPTLF